MGFQLLRSSVYGQLGRIHFDLGEVEKAQAYADKALDSARNDDNNIYQGMAWTWLGHMLGKKTPPEFDRAEEYILKGIQMAEEFKLRPFYSQGYLDLGGLYVDMGRWDDARKHLKKAEENFRDMGMDYYLKIVRNVLDKLKY
jgi:tetratricopeptide (TPR) repeat protein